MDNVCLEKGEFLRHVCAPDPSIRWEHVAAMLPAMWLDRMEACDYQKTKLLEIVRFRCRALVDLEMGMGKTFLSILVTLLFPQYLPALIVAPMVVIPGWLTELLFVTGVGEDDIQIIQGAFRAPKDKVLKKRKEGKHHKKCPYTKKNKTCSCTALDLEDETELLKENERRKHRPVKLYNVTTFDTYRSQKQWFEAQSFPTVIVDEATNAANDASIIGPLMIELCQKAVVCLLLSGTPLKKKAVNIWMYSQMLQPCLFPNKTHFQVEYCRWKDAVNKRNGQPFRFPYGIEPRTIRKLGDIVRRHFCVALTWEEVTKSRAKMGLGPLIPPHEIEEVHLRLDAEAEELSLKQLKEWREEKEKATKLAQEALQNAPTIPEGAPADGGDDPPITGFYDKVLYGRMVERILKLKRRKVLDEVLPGILDGVLQSRVPALLWAHRTETINKLKEAAENKGVRYIHIAGDVKLAQRIRMCREFEAKDSPYLLGILGLTAADKGVTLVNSKCNHFFEIVPTAVTIMQAMKRNHRLGQTVPTKSTFYIVDKSIDEVDYKGIQRELYEMKTFQHSVATGGQKRKRSEEDEDEDTE